MSIEIDIVKNMEGFTLDINFSTKSKITGILGGSGSGKSMTLKCIAGIEKPNEGIIKIDDNIIFSSEKKINLPTRLRKTGYLFQNYALFPNMTVEENILSGVNDTNRSKEILKKMTNLFRLQGLEKRKPYQISGGQQQRVALARIFASEPSILMLDEPFSALDSSLKDQIQMELLDILDNYDKDIILVSHSRDEIFRFCNDIVIIDNGKSVLQSSVKNIFSKPTYENVARLIGIKNIRKCEIIGDRLINLPEWGLELKTREKLDKGIDFVGIRARDIEICDSKYDDENYIEIEIVKISHEFNFISLFCKPKTMSNINFNDGVLPYIFIKIPRNRWKYEYSKMNYLRIKKSDIIPLKQYVY